MVRVDLGIGPIVHRVHLNRAVDIVETAGKRVRELVGIGAEGGVVAGDSAGELIVDLLVDLGVGDILPFIGDLDVVGDGIRVVEDLLLDRRHTLLGSDGRRAGAIDHGVHGRGERIGRAAVRSAGGSGEEKPVAGSETGKGRVARGRRLPAGLALQVGGDQAQDVVARDLRVGPGNPGVDAQPIGGILRVVAGKGRALLRGLDSVQYSCLGFVAGPRDVAQRRGSFGRRDRRLEDLDALVGRVLRIIAVRECDGRPRGRERHRNRRYNPTEAQRRGEAGGYCQACDVLAHTHLLFLRFSVGSHSIGHHLSAS